MRVILASKSPRRREILELMGLDFEVITEDTDESCDITQPDLLVQTLARRKGEAVVEKILAEQGDVTDTLFIACDTLVYADKRFLGKPRDRDDAYNMLSTLSGKSHEVWSGIYLYFNGKSVTRAAVTEVEFFEMTEEEKQKYLDSGEPFDKAGGYAVQGKAALYIKGLKGDYFNVVGLPASLLYRTLSEELGIAV